MSNSYWLKQSSVLSSVNADVCLGRMSSLKYNMSHRIYVLIHISQGLQRKVLSNSVVLCSKLICKSVNKILCSCNILCKIVHMLLFTVLLGIEFSNFPSTRMLFGVLKVLGKENLSYYIDSKLLGPQFYFPEVN